MKTRPPVRRPRRPRRPQSPLFEARRLARDRDLYRIVADSTYDCEVWLSPSGVPRYVSPSCLRLTGREAADAEGNPDFFQAVIHPGDYPGWIVALKDSFKGRTRPVDFRVLKPDGQVVHVAQEAALVPEGKGGRILGLHLSLRDVTDRVRAENALRQAREELEERVGERTAELDQANRELRREVMRNRRINKELARSREELRALTNYLQDRIEDERTWISREIHDELGQDITACNLGLFRLVGKLAGGDPETAALAAGLREILDGALASVRRISRRLRPPILDELGFVQAARALAKVFAETTGMAATVVAVRLAATRTFYVLEVEDDGVGIGLESLENPKSFGLVGMRERLRSFGGDLRLNRLKDRGTILRARLRRRG